ncbi:MAG: DCC1-like thiol-disulfide oxidoreductase family protein [Cyclobacteriaceae bacterium]|nr:DCC1-like thiol-disulfide oxidoreductase family protein [Cyclobacteriaceae bacterium]
MLKLDKKQEFDFARLSSNFGVNLLLKHQIFEDSIILWDKDKVITKSAAVLEIVKILGFPYSILLGFYILPKFIRDWIYDYIASHRKTWFGQTKHCLINRQKYPHRVIH